MKPDRKFMKLENDNLEFIPFDTNSPFFKNNSSFFPVSKNNNLRSNNQDVELPFLNEFINSTSNELYSYNKNVDYKPLNSGKNSESVPSVTDILRTLKLCDYEFDNLNSSIDVNISDDDIESNNTNRNKHKKCDPNEIFNKIKNNNPEILNTLRRYRIPYPIAKRLLTRVVYLSFKYCDKNNHNHYFNKE